MHKTSFVCVCVRMCILFPTQIFSKCVCVCCCMRTSYGKSVLLKWDKVYIVSKSRIFEMLRALPMYIDISSGTHGHHIYSQEISPHHSKFKWGFIKQNKNWVLNFFYVLTPNNAIVERFLTRLCLCAFPSFHFVYSYFIDFPVSYPSPAPNAQICLIFSCFDKILKCLCIHVSMCKC